MTEIDFVQLYAPPAVQAWRVPFALSADPTSGLIQGLRLVWSELAKKLADSAPLRFVCCDVLVLDKNAPIDRPTFVFARRIELGPNAAFVLDRTSRSDIDLTLFAQAVVDAKTGNATALPVTAVVKKEGADPMELEYSFQPEAGGGASGMVWAPRAEAAKLMAAKDIDPGHLLVGEPLWLALMTAFQVATLLSTQHPTLSIAQLRWVAALAQASPDSRQLASQARAMAADLQAAAEAARSNAVLVPRLDAAIWASEAQAMFRLLRDRNTTWEGLLERIHSDKNWAEDAATKLAETANQDDLSQKLEDQARGTRDQAMRALSVAIRQMVHARLQMRFRELDFGVGIERWKEDQTLKEIGNIVFGVFKLLEQIPAVVALGPELAITPATQILQAFGDLVVTGSRDLLDRLGPANADPGGKDPSKDDASEGNSSSSGGWEFINTSLRDDSSLSEI